MKKAEKEQVIHCLELKLAFESSWNSISSVWILYGQLAHWIPYPLIEFKSMRQNVHKTLQNIKSQALIDFQFQIKIP